MYKMDVSSPASYLAGGFLFFTFYFTLSNLLKYTFGDSLQRGDISIITEKCVSAIHAVIATTIGAIIVYNCEDVLRDRHWLCEVYPYIGLPYFYYDTWAMYKSYVDNTPGLEGLSISRRVYKFMSSQPLMMVHHLILPNIYFPIIIYLRNGIGDFFVGCFLMIEIAIPLISLRNILVQLKMKETTLYVVTGISMAIVFFIARVLIFPFMFWSYGQKLGVPLWRVPAKIPIKCSMGCLLLLLPQLYWVKLMFVGVYRGFRKRYGRRNEKQDNAITQEESTNLNGTKPIKSD